MSSGRTSPEIVPCLLLAILAVEEKVFIVLVISKSFILILLPLELSSIRQWLELIGIRFKSRVAPHELAILRRYSWAPLISIESHVRIRFEFGPNTLT